MCKPNVIILDKKHENAYENFLYKHKTALFYYSRKFKDFLKDLLECEEHYLIAVQDDKIVGALPLMKKKGGLGYVYNSLPFFGSNGGIISDNLDAFSALVDAYNKLVGDPGIAASTVISNPLVTEHYSSLQYTLTDQRIGQFTRLEFTTDPEKNLLTLIDSSTRRNIKKAVNSGIKITIDKNGLGFLEKVHYENMKKIAGKAKPERFFKLVRRHFNYGTDYNVYIAMLDNRPIAGLLLFYFNRIVEYYIPAIVDEFRAYQPSALIIYRAMIDAAAKGFILWNWGGTWLEQEGVYNYKKKWGTEVVKYFYFTQINNNDLYRHSPEEMTALYGNFYVIPFSQLKRSAIL